MILAAEVREEWIAKYGSDKGFSEYDLDGDGIIDADEFRKGIVSWTECSLILLLYWLPWPIELVTRGFR